MNIYFFALDVSIKGGTEGVTLKLANFFATKGHNVSIVSFFRSNETESVVPVDVKIIYLNNYRYPLENPKERIQSFLKCLWKLRKLKKRMMAPKTDVYIGQNFFANMLLWLVGLGKYAIGCEHFKYDMYSDKVKSIRNYVYSHFGKIVTLTDKDRDKFRKHLGEKMVITIPNMAFVKDDFELSLESKTIIAVGRLAVQKGFDYLIDAMKGVVEKHGDWKLNIWGEGDLREQLQAQIDRNSLQENITLCGYTTNVNSKFAESAFYVLSSRYEGLPLVLIEAFSLGVPAVAFDCPSGPAELLAEGGGILVETENVEKLTDAINYMIEHPEYRKECSKHKEYIRANLAPEVIYSKWVKLFNELKKV